VLRRLLRRLGLRTFGAHGILALFGAVEGNGIDAILQQQRAQHIEAYVFQFGFGRPVRLLALLILLAVLALIIRLTFAAGAFVDLIVGIVPPF
jgi:hypothetical protein